MDDVEAELLEALLPFAIAIEELGICSSLDEAFVWEPKSVDAKPMVTFGQLRAARDVVETHAPGLLATRFWRGKSSAGS